jgi:hypothetical protein
MIKIFMLFLFVLVLVILSMKAQNISDTTGKKNNVSLGPGALQNDSSGEANTAIGADAMLSNLSGSSNTASGYMALHHNKSGSENVALGRQAGAANISGSGNTFLGSFANCGIGFIPLSNVTAIGYRSLVLRNNSLVLGGTGANAVNVGIGVPAPHAELHLPNTNGKKIILFENANNDQDYFGFALDPTTLRYQSAGEHAFFVKGSPTEAMRIRSNGNVGIGRFPFEKLTVRGAISMKDSEYNVTNNATSPIPAGGSGTMVFSNGHFFGWNGTQWKQLDN